MTPLPPPIWRSYLEDPIHRTVARIIKSSFPPRHHRPTLGSGSPCGAAAKPIARNRSRDFPRTNETAENEVRGFVPKLEAERIYGSDLHLPPIYIEFGAAGHKDNGQVFGRNGKPFKGALRNFSLANDLNIDTYCI